MNKSLRKRKKVFRKKVIEVNGGKTENCTTIKDRTRRLGEKRLGRSILRIFI